jgi:chromosome segregation ATPase
MTEQANLNEIKAAVKDQSEAGLDRIRDEGASWLASLVEENERLTRFCNEWASGEDKFQEFGGWERIDEMKSEIASLRSQLVEVEQPKQRLLSELHNERIKKDQFLNERNALKAQLEEAQKTLEWYADERRYSIYYHEGVDNINSDYGERARETLKRLRGEQLDGGRSTTSNGF